MLTRSARQKSLFVYHLHMGGPDAAALEWRALEAARYSDRLRALGVRFTTSARDADIIAVTGLLTMHNLESVVSELNTLPAPCVLLAVGDAAINGGQWSAATMPGRAPYPLGHYAAVNLTVPGSPPTPQAIIAALENAAGLLIQPISETRNEKRDAAY